MDWLIIDLALIVLFALQHSLLTTRPAVALIGRITRPELWNFIYSSLSISTLLFIGLCWQSSGLYLYRLEGLAYYCMWAGFGFSLVLFFYCFKYTSFTQWLGVAQLYCLLTKRAQKPYYNVNKTGLKRYIRFPHHTALILVFWAQPVMTVDTLILAIGATLYTWLGTVHQDKRGLRIIGKEWASYQKNSRLILPSARHVWRDLKHGLLGSKPAPADTAAHH